MYLILLLTSNKPESWINSRDESLIRKDRVDIKVEMKRPCHIDICQDELPYEIRIVPRY